MEKFREQPTPPETPRGFEEEEEEFEEIEGIPKQSHVHGIPSITTSTASMTSFLPTAVLYPPGGSSWFFEDE